MTTCKSRTACNFAPVSAGKFVKLPVHLPGEKSNGGSCGQLPEGQRCPNLCQIRPTRASLANKLTTDQRWAEFGRCWAELVHLRPSFKVESTKMAWNRPNAPHLPRINQTLARNRPIGPVSTFTQHRPSSVRTSPAFGRHRPNFARIVPYFGEFSQTRPASDKFGHFFRN